MTASLSVVLPVYNERPDDLATTLDALGDGLRRSSWRDPEVVIVDDGSDPPVDPPTVPGARVTVVRQPNRGRFEARRAGLEAATGDHVLLLDSRVTLDPDGVAWVAGQVAAGKPAWNGHCLMANVDNPFARFWNVLTYAAFADYLDDPRTTSFGIEEYDRFPKGTGHFLAPRGWLLEAIGGFESRYEDSRFASDDTHLLRAIAERDRIHISPEFASVYRNREALGPFLKHALHRGTTFFDGFARPGTRFFPIVVATFPTSAFGILVLLRRPRLGLVGLGGLSGLGAAFALRRRRPAGEVAAFAALVPPFSVAYAAGIWRGLWLTSRRRAST